MKKVFAYFVLTVIVIGVAVGLGYIILVEPLIEAYQKDGWEGVFVELFAFVIILSLINSTINIIDWAIGKITK
jgi:hypothetical protein